MFCLFMYMYHDSNILPFALKVFHKLCGSLIRALKSALTDALSFSFSSWFIVNDLDTQWPTFSSRPSWNTVNDLDTQWPTFSNRPS